MAASRSSLLSLERPRCAQLFFVYAGRGEVGPSGQVSDAFLRTSGLIGRNLVLVRDPFDANYERGIDERAPDRAALVDWQRRHLASCAHVRSAYCIGNSSGGYGALFFGHELRVERVWAFSARPADDATSALAQSALHDVLSKPNGVTEYRLYYASENAIDRAFAESLADCPGVSLFPRLEFGDTHRLLRELSLNGELARMLPPFEGVT